MKNIKLNKGAAGKGTIFIILIMLAILALSYQLVGGVVPSQQVSNSLGPQVIVDTPSANPERDNLQLYTFFGTPVTPTPAITSPPQPVCTNSVVDVMIVFDRSGSMLGTKLTKAKTATKGFVDELAKNSENRVGLSIFSSSGSLSSGLTGDFPLVKQRIDQITANGLTCIACGIDLANREILAKKRAGVKQRIVLLSDGAANEPGSDSEARQAAITRTQEGFTQSAIAFYTIGYGDSDDEPLLRQIASTTGGQFYSSPSEDQLPQIFSQIGLSICQ